MACCSSGASRAVSRTTCFDVSAVATGGALKPHMTQRDDAVADVSP
ncbi:hypothetical protein D558_1081 [Bordetella holmesii 44057]|nr:hypothetical protein D558_1081 [Bordetella holmesii 44057]EWM46328.1 hypothetical protein D555_1101 [Bordetella holmesii 35009]